MLRLIISIISVLLISSFKTHALELNQYANQLKNYNSLGKSHVMVLGTFHFNQSVLSEKNQQSIDQLLSVLRTYQPTKIVVEWELHKTASTNVEYKKYINDQFDLNTRANEVYQLGFKLAKLLGHDQIYLFDDQTPYLGSLTSFMDEKPSFSFDLFLEYAQKQDVGFYDKHKEILTHHFQVNQKLLEQLPIAQRIALMNSPQHQDINAQRMHMFEMRIGIQKNWVGPDWLGRWYRRNIRMLSNVLKMAEQNDKILIIVGDNHKWLLDDLIQNTPDFILDSSWDLLNDSDLSQSKP